MVVLVLLTVGVAGVLIVKPLEKRLDHLMISVDQIGQEKSFNQIDTQGDDGLSQLGLRINEMSERIQNLLQHQKELTHAVSHELRTPIARLRFRLELLLNAQNTTEREKRVLGMQNDLHELNGLVDEILTYAKLDSDTPDLKMEIWPAHRLIDQVRDSVGVIQGDISLNWEHSQNQIYGDLHYLHRALKNLVGNALKFAASRIDIKLDIHNDHVVIKVSDDGNGIPTEDYGRIFEPFSRVDSSRNRKSGGYGLGLAITKQIVQWHEGHINVGKSQYNGAEFCIKIPVKTVN